MEEAVGGDMWRRLWGCVEEAVGMCGGGCGRCVDVLGK